MESNVEANKFLCSIGIHTSYKWIKFTSDEVPYYFKVKVCKYCGACKYKTLHVYFDNKLWFNTEFLLDLRKLIDFIVDNKCDVYYGNHYFVHREASKINRTYFSKETKNENHS